MIRELRASDAETLLKLMVEEFPEENRIIGFRPEGVRAIVQRLFRWDARIFLGLLRLVGRAAFHLYVIVDGDRVVGTTLLSFTPPTGYLSMVVVDPAYRGRGYARQLIEKARTTSAKRGRPYVALDVLEQNAPARRLYETSGYRPLRTVAYLVRPDVAGAAPPSAPPPFVRPFRSADARPLAALAQRLAPPEVDRVLPIRPQNLLGGDSVDRMLGNTAASFVIDRGRGPEGHVAAVTSPATDAAHLSTPILGDGVAPEAAAALLATAHRWLVGRGPARVVTMVPEYLPRTRAALEEAGYREALRLLTLYRSSA